MAQIDRINGLVGSIAFKAPCVVATTANITLSGTQTIDGVAVVANDRVLVKDQTTGSENGIYDASGTAWVRATDWNGSRDIVQGTQVKVNSGTGIGTYEVATPDPILIGTTSVSITSFMTAAEGYADAASDSADAAAASAASIALPGMTGKALNMLRANAGETALEYRTPAQVLSDIGAAPVDAKDSDIASSTALALGADGNYFDVTGTTTITSIDTWSLAGPVKLHFDGALTLTHHATDLILPGGANITTAAGDEVEFIEYASGDWRCTNYTKASGKAIAGSGALVSAAINVDTTNRSTTSTSYVDSLVNITGTLTNSANKFRIRVHGLSGASTNLILSEFTLYRDAVDLTPSGTTCMSAIYSDNATTPETIAFEVEDSPADTSAHTYKVYWKVASGTGYLGRRGSDTAVDAPTIMTLEEITA